MKNLTIAARLVILTSVLSVLLIVIGVMGLVAMRQSSDAINAVHEQAMVPALMADESITKTQLNRMQVLLAFQHAPDSPLSAIHAHPTSMHTDAIAANREQTNKLFKSMEALATSPQEIAILEKAKLTRAAWRVKLVQATSAIEKGDFSQAVMSQFLEAGRAEGEAAVKALVAYRDYKVKQANDEFKAAQDRDRNATVMFTLFIAVGLVFAGLLGFTTIRSIRNQLGCEPSEAVAVVQQIGLGNLSTQISPKHGGDSSVLAQLKLMQEKLTTVVSHVRSGSASVATASAEIASGNSDLSTRTEQQASALAVTASSMEALGSTVTQNAESARHANQLAQSASTIAIEGGRVVGEVVQTMKGINESSRRIYDIISVIDGIAFQTNILALNAAVEAARAGEQGRGFAVVASEVRSLAGRSAEAAKEIKSLISASVARVEQGTVLADQAGVTMIEVVESIRKATDIMGEINAASNAQAHGVEQVGEAVSRMDQSTQQNAALVEQMAAAASSLEGQAQDLVKIVAAFRLADGGHDTSSIAYSTLPLLSEGTS